MDKLESKLRDLSLRAPSHKLDDRVLGLKPERPSRAVRRVPLWSAVASCIVVAIVGFTAGALYRGRPSPESPGTRPPVRVELICDSPSGTNPFDFTAASADSPGREWGITVISATETST